MTNQTPVLAAALLVGASLASGQDNVPATPADALRQLLADPDVVLLKTARVFMPGRSGAAPQLSDGRKCWLVVRKGNVIGIQVEPDQPVEIARDEVKARVVDLTASHPSSVAMPGICDADSRFFLASPQLVDGQADFGTQAQASIETWQKGWEDIVKWSGVTAVYVPAAAASQAAGAGALVALEPGAAPRPLPEAGALFFRLSAPNTPGHSLSRAAAAKPLRAALEAAKQYREAMEKWRKDHEEYKKKRAEFLAYYAKNPMKPGDANERAEDSSRRGPPGTGSRVQLSQEDMMKLRQVPREQRQEAMRKLMEERQKSEQTGQAKPEEKKPEAKTDSKAPARPKAPKQPDGEPAKEALLDVLDGKATLRVEAHRAEEITALLEVCAELGVKRLAVVGGTEAWRVAAELRAAGATVVLTPQVLPPAGFETLPEHLVACAAKLAHEGVPVAFGSGGKERAAFLTSWAARAVALGMSPEQALQGLTENALAASGTPAAATGAVVFSGDPLAPTSQVVGVAGEQGWRLLGGDK